MLSSSEISGILCHVSNSCSWPLTSRGPSFWKRSNIFPEGSHKSKKVYFKKQLLAFLGRYEANVYLTFYLPMGILILVSHYNLWEMSEVPGFPHNYLIFVKFHGSYLLSLNSLCVIIYF